MKPCTIVTYLLELAKEFDSLEPCKYVNIKATAKRTSESVRLKISSPGAAS
jgi:hypothetical protein